MIPCDEEIYKMWDEVHLAKGIRKHILAVTQLVDRLADALINEGISINKEVLHAAALLHDILKIVDIPNVFEQPIFKDATSNDQEVYRMLIERYKGMHHEEAAAKYCEGMDPKISQIIRKHRFDAVLEGYSCWEEKILTYSDKRAKFDTIVTLRERFDDIYKRYNVSEDRKKEREEIESGYFAIEKEIFSIIPFTVEDFNTA